MYYTYLVDVTIAFDISRSRGTFSSSVALSMEVQIREGNSRIVESFRIELATASSGTSAQTSSHVIDDGIDVNSNSDVITTANLCKSSTSVSVVPGSPLDGVWRTYHVSKLLLGTRSGFKLVRNRLVAFPPGAAFMSIIDNSVFVRGRHLYGGFFDYGLAFICRT